MNHWLAQLENHLQALMQSETALVAGVSGGVDSMVLLDVLSRIAPRHRWKLTVAHFNHQLRGDRSDADEQLVVQTAQRLNIPCLVDRGDVKKLAQTHTISIEMAARQLRHEFFARCAAQAQTRVLALAHHADDQVELFFLRLFRGTGNTGLGGMKPRSPLPSNPNIQIIRPLLNERKEALLNFAKQNQIPFSEDVTNCSLDIQRNRIRHELIPLLLNHYQPGLLQTVPRLMEISAAEGEVVAGFAQRWLSDPASTPFSELPTAIQRRCVQAQVLALKHTPDFDLIEWLRLNPDRPISIASGTSIQRDSAGIVRSVEVAAPSFDPTQQTFESPLSQSGSCNFAGLKLSWEATDVQGGQFTPTPRCEFFDAGLVGKKFVLRLWRPGDRFQPIGTKSPQKLQDLFTNLKIPRGQRHQRVVAVSETGEVFWVEGLRISERFKLDKGTNRRLKWQWHR